MRFVLCLTCIMTLFGPAIARGQAAGAFARMGFGARGLAMGNALAADASGAASSYYNPALAPFTEQQRLSASAGLLSFDRKLQFVQFAAPLRPSAGVAAGLIHAGVSGIDGRDDSGYHTKNYSTDEYALLLDVGTRIGRRITVGAGLQFFRANYEGVEPVRGLGVDLGLTAHAAEGLHLGLVVDDLLARYSWEAGGSASDRFPTRIRLGTAYLVKGGQGRLAAEYELRLRHAGSAVLRSSRFRTGAEVWLTDAFGLRAGLDRLGTGSLYRATPSLGFVVDEALGRLGLRVAYTFVLEPYAVGSMHLLTLHLLFP